jgi:hypothetical protein
MMKKVNLIVELPDDADPESFLTGLRLDNKDGVWSGYVGTGANRTEVLWHPYDQQTGEKTIYIAPTSENEFDPDKTYGLGDTVVIGGEALRNIGRCWATSEAQVLEHTVGRGPATAACWEVVNPRPAPTVTITIEGEVDLKVNQS